MGELLNKQEQKYYFCGQLMPRHVSFSLGYQPLHNHNMSS